MHQELSFTNLWCVREFKSKWIAMLSCNVTTGMCYVNLSLITDTALLCQHAGILWTKSKSLVKHCDSSQQRGPPNFDFSHRYLWNLVWNCSHLVTLNILFNFSRKSVVALKELKCLTWLNCFKYGLRFIDFALSLNSNSRQLTMPVWKLSFVLSAVWSYL